MRFRPILLLLLCFLFALLPLTKSSAVNTVLRVNEAETRVHLREGETEISLAVENLTARPLRAKVRLEWVDPQDVVRNHTARIETIAPGARKIIIPLALVPYGDQDKMLWQRLRYRVEPEPASGKSFVPVTGIISLSEITPDIFELSVTASEYPMAGKLYRAHVRALHPITARPVGDVELTAELKFDNNREDSFKAAGVTNGRGYVALDFNLPRDLVAEDGTLEVKAARGEFKQEAEIELSDQHLGMSQILLTTDKPIYQPGQTLHVRALARDFTNRAIPNADLELKIQDPEGMTQFRADLKTSRFGVADVDWPIPENLRLGDYLVSMELEDDKFGEGRGGSYVKITRYDLPNFAVKTKPDHEFYLPGQNAEIEVRADYLFGQPVTKGHVRVVRETSRKWNYHEQKWETQEAEKYEGEIDATGRFVARIDLTKAHEDLADDRYRRFEDRRYAAYVTDATTGRTEQKRFDLRLSREAIHVYVIGLGYDGQRETMPFQFYVSTSYADGTPAASEVTISELLDKSDSSVEEQLRKIKTNKSGVAKVSSLQLRQRDGRDNEVRLKFAARDGKGAAGQHAETVWLRDRLALRLQTDKAIYRAGEPVEVQITASQPDVVAVLSVSRELQLLRSQMVRLRNGKAFVVLPYQREFDDQLTISVSANDGAGGSRWDPSRRASRGVIYPRDRELKLDVRLGAAEYRPGEEARASFRVLSANGHPVESALGVSVVDRAVEERARTDREFSGAGGYYNFIHNYLEGRPGLAGVSIRDLRKLDPTEPVSDELQLIAEILLCDRGYGPLAETSSEYDRDQKRIFADLTKHHFKPLLDALDTRFQKTAEYPRDRAGLDRILNFAELRFGDLRDPWGVAYRAEFTTMRDLDFFNALSAGADKKFDTADDFIAVTAKWPYFKQTGDRIRQTMTRFHEPTGRVTLNAAAFKEELKRDGLDFDALRDRWGKVYWLELSVIGVRWYATVRSSGANGQFDAPHGSTFAPYNSASDDFTVWTAELDYFQKTRILLDAALANHYKQTSQFPENDAELRAALKAQGIEFGDLRDPWNNEYHATFSRRFRYGDRIVITYEELQKTTRNDIKPVTQQINLIALRSAGADGREGTGDDFTAAEFARLTTEMSSADQTPQPVAGSAPQLAAMGAIKGVVTDASGAVIPGATVKVTHSRTKQSFEGKANSDGEFLLRNLPAGIYELECWASGFLRITVTDIKVLSTTLTNVNLTLQVGSVTETVTVTADVAQLQTESASTSVSSKKAADLPQKTGAQVAVKSELSTPRLRQHFQETLVWQPQLETDKQGRAQLKFKLADNITTWKLAVIGSTVDGQIGFAEKEFLAFQPFFAEHDPPRVLTEGDEIALPVVLRNYLDKPQTVTAEMKPESWFTLMGSARQQAKVAAGDAANAIFDFRVLASVKDGKQRITAIGNDASDAIEKAVSVHPDGEEVAQTASNVFANEGQLNIHVPEDAIKTSVRAELKIYPNLMAHALEGIEGILQRPYGCGEQTISSTYPNVMALRYLRQQGETTAAIAAKAERYIKAGHNRLLNYRAENGGFSYWGRGDADLALTAYAVRFLNDASKFVDVDRDIIAKALNLLVTHQQADGSWLHRYYYGGDDSPRSAMTTAYIARVLAIERARTETPDPKLTSSLQRALVFLAGKTAEFDEPYLLASYALAAMDAGEREGAANAIGKLRRLAREEAGTTYWHLESNTPFYGWGLAGRIETTALAVKALQKDRAKWGQGDKATRDELVDRGLLFLLRNKDRYGVWLSTQATINVLETLVGMYEAEKGKSSASGQAEVFVNGNSAGAVALPPGNRLSNPLTVELSSALGSGDNRIEIRRAGEVTMASAQLVETHYAPWKSFAAEARESIKPGKASALKLAVAYDKPQAKIGDDIACNVVAERIGHRGYGMMLAEIGLPPGADVDRASLEKAMKDSGWELSQYDVLPDRVVVYLWPRAGGIKFSFKFKLRYGIRAQSAPSLLYDYYNPEARVVIAPTRFVAR